MSELDQFCVLHCFKVYFAYRILAELYNKFSEEEKSKFMATQGNGAILDCIDSKGLEGERRKIKMDPVEVPNTDLSTELKRCIKSNSHY